MPNPDEDIWLVDVAPYSDDTAGVVTYRWCSGEGWASKTDATITYEPRIVDPGNYETSLFQRGTTGGRADVGNGNVVVNNGDHLIDAILNHGWDARALTIRFGKQSFTEVSQFETKFIGSSEQLDPSWNTYSIVMRDRIADVINMPLQQEQYAGDNSLPNGVEGVATDLKGKWKPVGFGPVKEFQPPMVNTSKYVFQLNWRQVASIQGVYVEGTALTPGTGHASLAALLAATVSGGTFDYYLGSSTEGCYVRLLALPDGKVTASFTVGATAADRTGAQIVYAMLNTYGGVSSGALASAAFDAVDVLNDAEIGYCSGIDTVKLGDAIDEVAQSIHMWWGIGATGLYTVGRIGPISGTSLGTIEPWQISRDSDGISFVNPRDANKGVPSCQVILYYQKNNTVQDEADLAGIVATDRPRVNFLKEEYRAVYTAVDTDVLAKHARSVPLEVYTLIDDATEAAAEADRLATLYGADHLWFAVKVDISQDQNFPLGGLVTLDTGRVEWTGANGRQMLVIGKALLFAQKKVQYTLWG